MTSPLSFSTAYKLNNNYILKTVNDKDLASASDFSQKIKQVNNTPVDFRPQTVAADAHHISDKPIEKNSDSFSMKNLNEFTAKLSCAAEKAIENLPGLSPQQKQEAYAGINNLKNKLASDLKYIFDEDVVIKKDIDNAIVFKKELLNVITKSIASCKKVSKNKARHEAPALLKKSLTEINNNEKWEKITKNFDYGGSVFTSQLTPAGQMKRGDKDIFPTSYNDLGISSASSERTDHATNLWISDFKTAQNGEEKSVFQGLRHGILSPYSLPFGSEERNQGCINRAKEVVLSALYLQPEKLEAALSGKTVAINLTSLSLVTPAKVPGEAVSEKNMLADQIKAWKTLSNAGATEFQIRDADGEIKNIKIDVDVAAFNIGVNNLAFGWLQAGKKLSDSYNSEALDKLIGKFDSGESLEPGGWAGEYLAAGPHANDGRVRSLSHEIKAMVSHESDEMKKNPYLLPRKILLLANEINSTPAWNCKSGKDRTGILDVEVKLEAAMQKFEKDPDKKAAAEKDLLENLMLHSGNREIQRKNTGIEGNKVLKRLAFVDIFIGKTNVRDRIGDANVIRAAKGGAKIA
ncbi:inositol phosphate phosphatase SopB [Kalamiella sp. sgz302252]|uniref:inositol phosphate phosphatase SopB n=1 Tax=Pantoea sp. sgz302252 TaxID=3341827 RepID=UPI0036D3153C